jgi:3-phenylpropionate/trans-cinnamate dioxygenase ferredoxin subunit
MWIFVRYPLVGSACFVIVQLIQAAVGSREGTEGTAAMALIKACKTEELKLGAALRINTTPPLAVFRLQDGFYATEDTCSHAQSSLAAGEVDLDDCTVECPYHASQFEIKTGRVLSLPATKSIKTFPVTIVGDEVFVETE